MIEYPKNEARGTPDNDIRGQASSERRFIADAVCPVCFNQIEHPVIMTEGADEVGRRLRTYFGYCSECSAAHVVIQFARGERWIIHKFRPAVVLGIANVINITNDWKLLSELPQPKQQPQTIDADEAKLLEILAKMQNGMKCCADIVSGILREMELKRGQSIDD